MKALRIQSRLLKFFWTCLFLAMTGLFGSLIVLMKNLGRAICCFEASLLMIFEAMFVASLLFLVIILLLGREKEH